MALSRHLAATTMIGLLAIAPAAAEDLHQVVFAAGDPSVSVATAPYTSLQEASGLVQRLAGVDVKVQPTAGATAASQAVAAGNAFYTWGGMTSLIAAATQDAQLVIISFDAGNNYRVAVPPDSPIRTVEDLKGKTIGTQSLGAAAYLYGLAVVGNAGLNAQRDVRWLPIGVGAQAVSALQSGQAAAYAGYDNPNAIIGILMGNKLRDLASPLNDLKGMSGILVRRDTLAKYPAVVAGLCKSLYASFVFARANPEATVRNHWHTYPDQKPSNKPDAQALAEGLQILQARLDTVAHAGPGDLWGYQPPAEMQHTADELFKAGFIKTRPDMAAISDTGMAEKCGRLDEAGIAAEAKSWQAPGK